MRFTVAGVQKVNRPESLGELARHFGFSPEYFERSDQEMSEELAQRIADRWGILLSDIEDASRP